MNAPEAGLHHDTRASRDVLWHHRAGAVGQQGGLERGRCRLPLHRRFGIDDFENDARRKLHRDRQAIVQAQRDFHVLGEIGALIPDHALRHMDLIEGVGFHEHVRVVVLIEVIVFAFVDEGLFDGIGGFVALLHLNAVGNPAHLQMGHRRALARMNIFGTYDDV